MIAVVDHVSHPTDANVHLDGPVVPVCQVLLGFSLSPSCVYLGLFAIHGLKTVRIILWCSLSIEYSVGNRTDRRTSDARIVSLVIEDSIIMVS